MTAWGLLPPLLRVLCLLLVPALACPLFPPLPPLLCFTLGSFPGGTILGSIRGCCCRRCCGRCCRWRPLGRWLLLLLLLMLLPLLLPLLCLLLPLPPPLLLCFSPCSLARLTVIASVHRVVRLLPLPCILLWLLLLSIFSTRPLRPLCPAQLLGCPPCLLSGGAVWRRPRCRG